MSKAYCCEICDAADPHWVIERRGDAVITWSCDDDLSAVVAGLQRDHEVTAVIVADSRKAREWAGIGRALERIAVTGDDYPDRGAAENAP